MKKYLAILATGVLLATGCSDTIVATENSPSADAFNHPLSAGDVQVLATGVLAADRVLARETEYVILSEIYARDVYRIDPNESRYVTETLGGTADPGGFSGSGGWANGYYTIRAANTLVDKLPTANITASEKAATSGFIRTIKALEYYRLTELHDTLGVAYQPADPTQTGNIMCKTAALTYIAALLDSANTDLTTAGAATRLPFTLPTGFTGHGRDYGVVSNLVLFNRGLKGKVDLYRALDHQAPKPALFATAITELTQALGGAAPGTVASSTFKNGAFLTFVAGGTENTPNPISDSRIGVNPKVVTDTLQQYGGLQPGDTRASMFIPFPGNTSIAGSGISTNVTYVGASTADASNLTKPIPILTDEELVLLRAQAEYENSNFAAGNLDVNSVRSAYRAAPTTAVPNPLPPVAAADIATARLAVLYEKRFSLFFQGPQRLVDLRAYGLMKPPASGGLAPAEVTGDPFNTAFPIPKTEADVRGGRQNLTPVCS